MGGREGRLFSGMLLIPSRVGPVFGSSTCARGVDPLWRRSPLPGFFGGVNPS